MNVFVIGGTGFLGYHATLKFCENGHRVATMSLPDLELGSWFPRDVDVTYGDIFQMDERAMAQTLEGSDVVVYAVGPDDRFTPTIDAYEFFHERLVETTARVAATARTAGVKKFVLLGSYFAYFDRLYPHRKLARHHPYIRCRVEQAQRSIDAGGGEMGVSVLELPYIFGSMPGREPLWKEIFVRMLVEHEIIYFPRGGSAMICVENVAEAIVGAARYGQHGERYPLGAENLSWKEMIRIMLDAMDMGHKRVITVPNWVVNPVGTLLKAKEMLQGLHSGLDLGHLMQDIQTQYFYLDPHASMMSLGHNCNNVRSAIAEAARVSHKLLQDEAAS